MKGLLKLAMVSTIALAATPAFAQSADWTKKVFGIVASKQTYPRVAQMRGDEGTAKVRVHRAMEKLRALLKKGGVDAPQ